MPNLSIKNVPDGLLSKLREQATRHHRSIQGELMALLSAALESPATSVPSAITSDSPALRRRGSRRIEEIAAEHRARWKKPFTRGPRAVDVVRADRDAR